MLEVENLQLSIDKRPIVHGVSFTIQPGETVALVGASGCGKSLTAQSILLPVAQVDQGSILFQGEDLLKKNNAEMQLIRGKKIGIIFQDPTSALNPTMRIGEQIAEGMRQHGHLGNIIQLLKSVGIADPEIRAKQYPFELSGGMRQRVMIAMAIACDPVMLIADEPTTALDLTIQAQILALLKSIQQERSLSLLFITHDLGVVAGISDRVLVMNEGKIVESGTTDQIFYAPQHPVTKHLFAAYKGSEKQLSERGKVLLQLQNVSKRYPVGKRELKAVSQVDLTLYKGETLALIGESGCGKSTLGKLAIGLEMPTEGTLLYDGQPFTKALRRKIQPLFQNPYGSLNPRMRVQDILEEPFVIHRDLKKKNPILLLEEVGLSADYLKRYPHQLSGGQRQRIALARALAVDPEFLVLDEPLSALDASSQHQILELLKRLKREKNLTYLFISHDLTAVKTIADRIAVFYLGELMELAETESLFQSPAHPYTQALLSAICLPDPNVERTRKRLLLHGDLPSPLNPPPGCPFQTRCPYVQPICKAQTPRLENGVKCHFNKKAG